MLRFKSLKRFNKNVFFYFKKKLLEQATNRLQLRNAARRLYTEDGVLILDINDLIEWVIDYYRRELNRMETALGKHELNLTSFN